MLKLLRSKNTVLEHCLGELGFRSNKYLAVFLVLLIGTHSEYELILFDTSVVGYGSPHAVQKVHETVEHNHLELLRGGRSTLKTW